MIAARAALRSEVGMTVQEPVGSSSSVAVLEAVARIGDGNGASERQLIPMSARAPVDRGEQHAGIGQTAELFDEATVVRFLVKIGELDGDMMLGSTLIVQNYSRRNRCLIVHGAGRGWVVKQGADAETVQSVCREIQIYLALRDGAVQFATPRLVYEDHDGGVLIVEYVTGVPLRDALAAGSPFDPVQVAEVLGNLLVGMHSCSLVDKFTELPSPWILNIFRPRLEMLQGFSGGSVELISLLQSHPHVFDFFCWFCL
jgi:Phosphotransferase enzyme family